MSLDADLRTLIRTIPDHPKPGIQFRDVSTLLLDGPGFAEAINRLAAMVAGEGTQLVAGIEARGFVFAAALAYRLKCGLLMLRKPGKLPGATVGIDYKLEYGSDRLEMHADACGQGMRVVLVDDLIATGGTAVAAVELLRSARAAIDTALFLVDLPNLGGADRLRAAGVTVRHLVAFEGD
jgi:adenine phosphoribosyltransferase